MNQDGALARGGNLQQADETRALDFMRRALVVVVEADFAAGDDLGLSQQGVEFGKNAVVDFGCVVGIDASAGVKLRDSRLSVELPANVQRLMHLGRLFADADGQHRTHARLTCAM